MRDSPTRSDYRLKMVAYPAGAIANWFLDKAESAGRTLTPMQVLKLVYFAHGWHLAISDTEPLIEERVEAWKFGPVVPDLYREFRTFKAGGIVGRATMSIASGDGNYEVVQPSIPASRASGTSGYLAQLLEAMWDRYGHLDGLTMSQLTHREGTPWDIVWNQKDGKSRLRSVIPDNLIAKHFRELLSDNLSADSAS